jgi:hypothetical protein
LKILVTIFLLSIQSILFSQIKVSYSIGVFGADLKTTTYSNPVSISGQKCIAISDGISKFLVSGKGMFLNACSLDENFIKYSILIAPNPAFNYTTIKFKNKLQSKEDILISIFNSTGTLIDKYPTTQTQLLQGFHLSTLILSNGLYFIQISSDRLNQVLRLLIAR